MKYITANEAAQKWNIELRSVTRFCRENKIPNAIKENGAWLIPIDAKKPLDGRLNKSKFAKSLVKKPLPIGISDFKEAVSNYYYVDKTDLIIDIIDDLPKVSLFTRPRRFGKTLTMDMLRVFFEKTDEDTSVYFIDKKIWAYGEKYRSYQGKYPVIYLSFKDVKFSTWSETFEKLQELFQAEFLRHNVIVKSKNSFDKSEIAYFNSIVNKSASEVALTSSLAKLSKMLHDFYKVPPVIIIDEYDTPIQQGYTKKYYNQVISFMRNLFSGAFKDNSHLSFGFMTGILRVAKESIFSGMNNLIENSVLSSKYSSYFGFTKDEVKTMLITYGHENKFDEVTEWFDGYLFGSSEIFNPWSVISYIANDCVPQPYWQNTGSNDIIREIITKSPADTKEKLQLLLEGKSIIADIDSSVIYPEITDNPQTVFSFLLIAGYLKVVRKADVSIGNTFCYVSIPNKEIQCVYGKEILSSLNDSHTQSTAISIQQAIVDSDVNSLQTHLQKYLKQTISIFDTGNEGFYQGLMLGLYGVMNNLYSITSNRESGDGRFDIQMIPFSHKTPPIIIELKVLHSDNTDSEEITRKLKELSEEALKQINDKHYDFPLKDNNSPTKVLKIGIAFYKKQTEISYSLD